MTNNLPTKPMSPIPGLEGIDQNDLTIPRIKIVQPNSVEVHQEIASFSSMVNSVTKEVIAKGTKSGSKIEIIPIINNKSRLYFKPISEGGGLLCRSNDNKTGVGDPGGNCSNCDLGKWGKDGDKNIAPECMELINVFCLVRTYDFPIPLVISFGKTSAAAGRQLINLFYFACQKDKKSPWNFAYQLETEIITKDKHTWAQFKIGHIDPEEGKPLATKEEIKIGADYYEMIKSAATVEVHADEEEMEEEAEIINDKEQSQKTEPDENKPPF